MNCIESLVLKFLSIWLSQFLAKMKAKTKNNFIIIGTKFDRKCFLQTLNSTI